MYGKTNETKPTTNIKKLIDMFIFTRQKIKSDHKMSQKRLFQTN